MAFVLELRPTKDGRKYYYLNWFAKINGRTKRIKQIYIGTLKSLAEKLEDPLSHTKLKSYSFGHYAAFFNILEKLNLEEIFKNCLPKKYANITFESLLLIVLNRLDEPRSKNKINKWFKKSMVQFKLDLKKVSSQSLWNQMNYIDDNTINLIKLLLVENIQKQFTPNDIQFNYDQTNFFTYCQEHGKLLKKGRNKRKRYDKNQIGVSLLVGQESEIPYYYNTYPGNTHDSKEFTDSIDSVKELLSFIKQPRITLIFDKGNRSDDIFKELDCVDQIDLDLLREYDFISSLAYSEAKELLKVPFSEYKDLVLANGKKVSVFSTEKTLYNIPCKVVVSFNEHLYIKQNKTYLKNKAKFERILNSLQTKVYISEKNIFTELQSKLKGYLYSSINVHLIKKDCGFSFDWSWKTERLDLLENKLGKNILFSSHLTWSSEKIVLAYRTSYKVEKLFKYFNDSLIIPIDPMYHWTDSKIKVHVFCCYIGLVIVKLLEYDARQIGITMEYKELLENLKNIRVCLLKTKSKVHFKYETLAPEQVELIQKFQLNKQFNF